MGDLSTVTVMHAHHFFCSSEHAYSLQSGEKSRWLSVFLNNIWSRESQNGHSHYHCAVLSTHKGKTCGFSQWASLILSNRIVLVEQVEFPPPEKRLILLQPAIYREHSRITSEYDCEENVNSCFSKRHLLSGSWIKERVITSQFKKTFRNCKKNIVWYWMPSREYNLTHECNEKFIKHFRDTSLLTNYFNFTSGLLQFEQLILVTL